MMVSDDMNGGEGGCWLAYQDWVMGAGWSCVFSVQRRFRGYGAARDGDGQVGCVAGESRSGCVVETGEQ